LRRLPKHGASALVLLSAWPQARSRPAQRARIMGRATGTTATVPVTTGTGRRITDPDMGLTPITAADRTTATATGAIAGNQKARSIASGLFLTGLFGRENRQAQRGGRLRARLTGRS